MITESFDGLIESFAAVDEIFADLGIGEDDDAEEFLAAGNERSAVIHAPAVGGGGRRRRRRTGVLVGEVFDHLQDDAVGSQELQRTAAVARNRRQEHFGVERFDDGQRLGHRFDEQVDGQVVDDDAERVPAQTVDEVGRFAVLPVLRQHQNFLFKLSFTQLFDYYFFFIFFLNKFI